MDSMIENRLLAHIAADELAQLEPHLERIVLGHGDPLIIPNQPIQYVHFPINALASLVTVFEDGSTVEAGSVGREGMVGVPVILGVDSTPMQTLIQIPGELLRIRASVVKEVFEQGKTLYRVLNRYIHALFVIASQSAGCNRKHQIEARMSRWLLMSSDGIGGDDIALTHEFLAAMLGVRRPGVTETAQKLQEAGLIDYHRGGIRILDRAGLTRAACECYHVVRSEFELVVG